MILNTTSTSVPAFDDIKTGTHTDKVAGCSGEWSVGFGVISCALTAGESYKMVYAIEDGTSSARGTLPITLNDINPIEVWDETVSDVTGTTIDIEFDVRGGLSADAKVYWMVYDQADTAPSAGTVRGQATTDGIC